MPQYALSEEFRNEFKFKCIDSLIPQPRTGNAVVPVFTGDEDKQAAMSWLTLFTQWALQQGLSADHTLLLASTHIKYSLIYYPQLSTWTEFVQDFFAYYHAVGDSLFIQWYWKRAANIQICWFSYRELKTATNNFSEHKTVGAGKAGVVFKGVLSDDRVVAVKRYTEVVGHSLEDILYEVFIHRSLPKSSNLVKLIGFSSYEQDPLLVYEYVEGGNLEQHLQGIHGKKPTWNERLSIAIDVADAISQLHYNRKFPIYHRDIKSSNILLDDHRQAKLADFGMAAAVSPKKARSYCQTKVKGSRGYTDPHYESTGKLTDTTDVYSFGVVLMELVTSLNAGDPSRSKSFLPDLVMEMYSLERLDEIVDECILAPCPCKQCLKILIEEVIELAILCCHQDPTKRPKISELAEKLRLIQLEQKMRSMEAELRDERRSMEVLDKDRTPRRSHRQ
ncbi:protein MpRLK-Pelle_WAK_LRK10L-3 [Marchantia polymorpha subsp. ruderalis]|uniref:Protein kinase domain-containing protein n=2 Tax=Marchantia polymorpha TaxID=3197 RepID=A0AAF6B3P3_MARPO|nr:hypothetical protein MARPO_0024s0045 [Marchantia polymorpha]BBN06627.1 hypothetical protein Mp_3g22670 [Marchantia polymorpha subsp. ruderalis]|eukprot:PTQ43527.1 hypothetical protein MARPO_0024s0045 [Marchantia polymorpha]